MLGHALCQALSFHSQTISHSITNNLPQSKQLLRSLNNGCELLPIVMGVDLVPLHYSQCIDLHLENSPRPKSALRIPNRMKLGIPGFVADHKNTASKFIHHFFTVSIRKMSVNQIYQDRLPL